MSHTIAAASRVLVVSPGASDATTLLQYDEVLAIVALDQIYRCAHATNASTNDDYSSFRVVSVSCRYRRPCFRACHVVGGCSGYGFKGVCNDCVSRKQHQD